MLNADSIVMMWELCPFYNLKNKSFNKSLFVGYLDQDFLSIAYQLQEQ